MRRGTIVGATVGLVVIAMAGLWYGKSHRVSDGPLANPYALSQSERATVLNYFTAAGAHAHYEVTASTLHRWLLDKKPVLMMDVRQPYGPDGYNRGHVPGAVNIPLQAFGQELMATHTYTATVKTYWGDQSRIKTAPIKFFPLPHNEPIVVMCYDGNGGEMTPVILRLLGFDAYGLRWGVSGWNQALDVWPTVTHVNPLPVTGGQGNTRLRRGPSGSYDLGVSFAPALSGFYQNLNRTYPSGYARPWTILAETLYEELKAPHPPVVVDLRSPVAYGAGHIPGSINIPFDQLGGNLSALPGDSRQVVLVSQTLQQSAEACAILRILGYRAYVLKQGLATWNPEFAAPASLFQYPIVTGAAPQ